MCTYVMFFWNKQQFHWLLLPPLSGERPPRRQFGLRSKFCFPKFLTAHPQMVEILHAYIILYSNFDICTVYTRLYTRIYIHTYLAHNLLLGFPLQCSNGCGHVWQMISQWIFSYLANLLVFLIKIYLLK